MNKVKSGGNKLLAIRIANAIADSGLKGKDIAAFCQVSPQAVTGWKEHGRIGKETLAMLAAATKKPLSYFSTIDIPGIPEENAAQSELNEVLKLLTLFKDATTQGRQMILESAEEAPKIALVGRKAAGN